LGPHMMGLFPLHVRRVRSSLFFLSYLPREFFWLGCRLFSGMPVKTVGFIPQLVRFPFPYFIFPLPPPSCKAVTFLERFLKILCVFRCESLFAHPPSSLLSGRSMAYPPFFFERSITQKPPPQVGTFPPILLTDSF